MTTEGFRLHHMPGWGSALIDVQMDFYGLPCARIAAGNLYADTAAVDRLRTLNPRAQLPTLVLPSGEVMTESAAITLHLADLTGRDDLVPHSEDGTRAAFLRWLIYLVANVYATFPCADVPTRFVDEGASEAFATRVLSYRKTLWSEVEAATSAGPWFLGDRMTAIDLYLAVMTHWRPGRGWFAAETPRLAAIAARATAHPGFASALARNFPD